MEPPWSLIDGGRFPGLSAVSVRDKAKLGSRGVYLISIYPLQRGSSVACVTQNYNRRNSTNISLRAWAELRHRRWWETQKQIDYTTRQNILYFLCLTHFKCVFTRRYMNLLAFDFKICLTVYIFFPNPTGWSLAGAGWRAAQIISGTNDPNAALILSLIYLPRPASSQPRPRAGCPLY